MKEFFDLRENLKVLKWVAIGVPIFTALFIGSVAMFSHAAGLDDNPRLAWIGGAGYALLITGSVLVGLGVLAARALRP